MRENARTRGERAFRSTWAIPIVAIVLLAPNGMNRLANPFQVVAEIAGRYALMPKFGTRVAARCVDAKQRIRLIDIDQTCPPGTTRSDVYVQPAVNVPRALPAPSEAETVQQCAALDGLLRTIDEEQHRPWPEARKEELRELRHKALEEQRRLAC